MADAPSHQSSANRSPVVLLLPQNGQHLETTLILIPELVAHEMVPEVMLMDGVFHQDLDPGLVGGTAHIRQLLVTLDRPFYRMTPLGQVRAILRSVRPMRRAVGHPAVIIAFNDGALQRLAMRLARPAKVAILLDGMISDYAAPTNGLNRVRSLLKGFGRLVRATPAGIILPSDVGLSPADVVFVLGRHSAEVLVSMRSRAAQVVATGLPRWPHATGTDRPSSVRRVLYLTGCLRMARAARGRRGSVPGRRYGRHRVPGPGIGARGPGPSP